MAKTKPKPSAQPEQQPEQQPGQQPEQQPGQQPEQQPGQQPVPASTQESPSQEEVAGSEGVVLMPLTELHLDTSNPRLGGHTNASRSEVELLDIIADVFSIDDVLSSIAVNGYFDAEPLVGVREEKGIRIAEGNRRLAACLVLAGDPRAKNQLKRTTQFQALQRKHNREPLTEVPVLIHENTKDLLSYLGVRHIAAAQPWDSYAKAAWVARVLNEGHMTLDDVSQMIGDQHRTVARILEGYYFVTQLQRDGRFNPRDSYRPGRGSNPDYPFSWVYTALGYAPIRRWLGIEEAEEGVQKEPLNQKHLQEGEELLRYLFGNKSKEFPPAIDDSRQISELAKIVGDTTLRRELNRKKNVKEVSDLNRPVGDRLTDSLLTARDALDAVTVILSQGEVKSQTAQQLEVLTRKVRALAVDVHKRVTALAEDDEDSKDV